MTYYFGMFVLMLLFLGVPAWAQVPSPPTLGQLESLLNQSEPDPRPAFVFDADGSLTESIVMVGSCHCLDTIGLNCFKQVICQQFGATNPDPVCSTPTGNPSAPGCIGSEQCAPPAGAQRCVKMYNPAFLPIVGIGVKDTAQMVSTRLNESIALLLQTLSRLPSNPAGLATKKIIKEAIKRLAKNESTAIGILVDPLSFDYLAQPPYLPETIDELAGVVGFLSAQEAHELTEYLRALERSWARQTQAIGAFERAQGALISCLVLRSYPPAGVTGDPPRTVANAWGYYADLYLANARYEAEAARTLLQTVTFTNPDPQLQQAVTKMRTISYAQWPQLVNGAPSTLPALAAVSAASLQNCQ